MVAPPDVPDRNPIVLPRVFRDTARLWVGRLASLTVALLAGATSIGSYLALTPAMGARSDQTIAAKITLGVVGTALFALTIWIAIFTVRWFRLALIVTASTVIVRNKRSTLRRPRSDIVGVTVGPAPIKGQFIWLEFRATESVMVDALGGYDTNRLKRVAADIRESLGLPAGIE